MPWPVFYGTRIYTIFKVIIGAVLLCLVTATYPLLYLLGVWYLIRNKKKPNWLYFALYTGLLIWYVFVIVKYMILGFPVKQNNGWPSGDTPVFTYHTPVPNSARSMICRDENGTPFDDRLEIDCLETGDETVNDVKHFRLTIRDPQFEYEWLNRHRVEQNLKPLNLTASQIRNLGGTYAWNSKIKFATQAQLLNYVCTHFDEMQQYKEEDMYLVKTEGKVSKESSNIPDEYNDRLEDYLADPEDEIEYSPEVFDFQDE